MIYPNFKPIDKENICFLLEFGDRYQIEALMKKCEQFLDGNSDYTDVEKFLVSEKYKMAALQVCYHFKVYFFVFRKSFCKF